LLQKVDVFRRENRRLGFIQPPVKDAGGFNLEVF